MLSPVLANDLADWPCRPELNARMRRIDLICKLAGPLFIALINGASTTAALWITLGLNTVSLPIEYFAIAQVSPNEKNTNITAS